MGKPRIAPPPIKTPDVENSGRWDHAEGDVNIPIPRHLRRFRGPAVTICGYFYDAGHTAAPTEVSLELLWSERVAGFVVVAYVSLRTRRSYVAQLDANDMMMYAAEIGGSADRRTATEFAEATASALATEIKRSTVVRLYAGRKVAS
jgi:hypothetical protein